MPSPTQETRTERERWRRYCELKAAAMEKEAAVFDALAVANAANPQIDEKERAEMDAHFREMASRYRDEHAPFWRKQVAA